MIALYMYLKRRFFRFTFSYNLQLQLLCKDFIILFFQLQFLINFRTMMNGKFYLWLHVVLGCFAVAFQSSVSEKKLEMVHLVSTILITFLGFYNLFHLFSYKLYDMINPISVGGGANLPPVKHSQISKKRRRPQVCTSFPLNQIQLRTFCEYFSLLDNVNQKLQNFK